MKTTRTPPEPCPNLPAIEPAQVGGGTAVTKPELAVWSASGICLRFPPPPSPRHRKQVKVPRLRPLGDRFLTHTHPALGTESGERHPDLALDL